MKTLKKNWTGLAGAFTLAVLAVGVVYGCLSAWGQTLPGLSIAMTNGNSAVWLVVTNGTPTGSYQIYRTEFLDEDAEWELFTNGATGVTNFIIPTEDYTSRFYVAVNYTNTIPFVLNLTIQAPASGANIQ